MAEIVNLRQARKRKALQDEAARAESNRIRFGRTKAEKQKTTAERRREAQKLDGHKRGE